MEHLNIYIPQVRSVIPDVSSTVSSIMIVGCSKVKSFKPIGQNKKKTVKLYIERNSIDTSTIS